MDNMTAKAFLNHPCDCQKGGWAERKLLANLPALYGTGLTQNKLNKQKIMGTMIFFSISHVPLLFRREG